MENKQQQVQIVPKQNSEKRKSCIELLTKSYELPSISLKNSAFLCFSTGIIFIIISIPMFVIINEVQEFTYQYYDPDDKEKCNIGQICVLNLELPSTLNAPIYILYQIGDFYQNHRLYIQSKSNYQLGGNTISTSSAKVCQPYITNKDMNKTQSWANITLDPDSVASPCGSIAFTYFNDEYTIKSSKNQTVAIQENSITWPGDRGKKYRKSDDSSSNQWIDPENEHFIVWMQTSGLLNFKKLYGIINEDLQDGNYIITIENNYNSSKWEGERNIILTTNSVFGGRNFVFPVFVLLIGISCFVAGGFFLKKRLEFLKKEQEKVE